jgi:hypothetical protein
VNQIFQDFCISVKGVPYLTTFIWFGWINCCMLVQRFNCHRTIKICEQLLLGNNTASSPLCVAVHRMYYGIFYFLNIIVSQYTHKCNFTYAHEIKHGLPCASFHETPSSAQQHYVQIISYAQFYQRQNLIVEITGTKVFIPPR